MTAFVSLLRGVNVGGHHQIKMETLRDLYESLGLRSVETFIQSGNVVFQSAERRPAPLAARIETAIELRFGFRPAVILRTPAELRKTIARNPFAKRRGIEPNRLLVTFFASAPNPEGRAKVLAMKPDPEELFLDGRELYIYYPNGAGRSKLTWTALEKVLGTPGTARNWNTVSKLLEMAEKSEVSR